MRWKSINWNKFDNKLFKWWRERWWVITIVPHKCDGCKDWVWLERIKKKFVMEELKYTSAQPMTWLDSKYHSWHEFYCKNCR